MLKSMQETGTGFPNRLHDYVMISICFSLSIINEFENVIFRSLFTSRFSHIF